MKSGYLVWEAKLLDNVCTLDVFKGVERSLDLNEGIPCAKDFPQGVTFQMDLSDPHDMLLADNLRNGNYLIVVSKKLKEFLESRSLKKVEYLPVTILDHKGRVASPDYFIVHPIDPVDCLDLDECSPTYSTIDPETINYIKELVLDESKVDPERELFRTKNFYTSTLVRQDLAEAIEAEGFDGVQFLDLENFDD
jgi:hypothetical protein